jgi:hypothetical protein
MSSLFTWLTANWIPLAAAFGALGHLFPAKTVANKIATAIVNTASPQQAAVAAVASVVTDNTGSK